MASIQHRPGRPKPWRVRYRDPQGGGRSQSFVRKVDARAFANAVETGHASGQYLDPEAGKVMFAEFAGRWAASLTVDAKRRCC
ncbi:MAG TPA: hypothetical protein VM287_03820 [Egibacteraceae bacterium]|nr:hypothetical protein [Egibacteraceae bacterium]